MNLLDKIKEGLKQGSEKVSGATGKIVEKGRKVGGEGLEFTKDVVANISEKASDIAALSRLKFELLSLEKNLNGEYLNLGKIALDLHNSQQFSPDNEAFREQLQKVEKMYNTLQAKKLDYEELRRVYSDNYVVNQLSDDLASADATIEKAIISKRSNVVNKTLKEVLLPKEALISAVKRNDDIIIPDGNTRLEAGDQVIIIGKKEDVEKVAKRLTGS